MAKAKTKQALAPVEDVVVVQLPTPEQGAIAVRNYAELKTMLDKELEDCIVMVQTRGGMKPFRKKTFWRAIGNCFKLSYEIKQDKRVELDDDWGYEVTVRATTVDGRFSDGDGSCFASEKSAFDSKVKVHDVRAHAKTRATNRAIADLVAFGEVSFEEVSEYKPSQKEVQVSQTVKPGRRKSKTSTVSETHQTEMDDAFKVIEPPPPKKTLEDHDGDERVTEVIFKRKYPNGGELYGITTTRRKYTCFKEDVRKLAEQALAEGLVITANYEAKTGTPKDGGRQYTYNALNGIELIYQINPDS